MSIKLIISGIAGAGKTDLLSSLGEETFVISRDAKEFGLPIPHMLVDKYVDMTTLIHGSEKFGIEGVFDKVEKYKDHFGKYPENVVIDSVSQLTMDVIDMACQKPNVYGSQGTEITKELAVLTKFIHEDLELNGINVILLNHVTEEKVEGKFTGVLLPFGQGQFKAKGGFYATTNEAITLVKEGSGRAVYFRGSDKQARTSCKDLPEKSWVESTNESEKSRKLKEGETYFTLKGHLEFLKSKQVDVKKWSL